MSFICVYVQPYIVRTMDATQVINDSILESEEEDSEEENENKRRQPRAKLRILRNEHIPEAGKCLTPVITFSWAGLMCLIDKMETFFFSHRVAPLFGRKRAGS